MQSAVLRCSSEDEKPMNVFDAKRIKELLRDRAAELAPHLFPNGKREGNNWCVGDISGVPGHSFKICVAGEKAGLWGDFADSQEHSRNLIDLWMHARNVDFKTALREASQWLGVSLSSSPLNCVKRNAPNGNVPGNGQKPHVASFDWQLCVAALTGKHLEGLAKWRGYSNDFCLWVKKSRLVGLHNACLAFYIDEPPRKSLKRP